MRRLRWTDRGRWVSSQPQWPTLCLERVKERCSERSWDKTTLSMCGMEWESSKRNGGVSLEETERMISVAYSLDDETMISIWIGTLIILQRSSDSNTRTSICGLLRDRFQTQSVMSVINQLASWRTVLQETSLPTSHEIHDRSSTYRIRVPTSLRARRINTTMNYKLRLETTNSDEWVNSIDWKRKRSRSCRQVSMEPFLVEWCNLSKVHHSSQPWTIQRHRSSNLRPEGIKEALSTWCHGVFLSKIDENNSGRNGSRNWKNLS